MPVVAFLRRLVRRIDVWAARLRRALKFAIVTFLALAALFALGGAWAIRYAATSCTGAACTTVWASLGGLAILVGGSMIALGWYLVTRWHAIRRAGGKVGSRP